MYFTDHGYKQVQTEDEYEPDFQHKSHSKGYHHASRKTNIIVCLLSLSLLLNVLMGLKTIRADLVCVHTKEVCRTRFAQLEWNSTGQFEHQGLYDSANVTLTNMAWDELNYDLGSVALSDDYVDSIGLPRAQRFPWDYSKGIYFLNAYHGVHCLKILRTTMIELRDGLPLSFAYAHSMHCLEALLQDVICFADDTPRYTSEEHPGEPGELQPRTCRDWKRLEAFAQEHTSCWRDIEPNNDIDTLLRYRYCPPGSPYYDKIHAIFGDFETGPDANSTN